MNASIRLIALGAFASLAAFSMASADADTMDGSDYHPLQMNSAASADIDAGAMAAARPIGTEAVGQSTSAPLLKSTMSSDEIYKGAMAAARPTGTEAIGQSTAMPMLGGTSTH
jgi:hypothetical protein